MGKIAFEQFRDSVLDQGWEDYSRDKVKVSFTGGAFYGTVSSDNSAIARVSFNDRNGFGRMICNCRDARKNRKCRHMAATLMAVCDGDFECVGEDFGDVMGRIMPFLPDDYTDDYADYADDYADHTETDADYADEEQMRIENLLRQESEHTRRQRGERGKGEPAFAEDKTANPFRKPPAGARIYYDLHRIMAPYEVTMPVLAKAQRLIKENGVNLHRIERTFLAAGDNDQCLHVEGTCENRYDKTYVSLTVSAKRLVSISCSGYECYNALSDYHLQFSDIRSGTELCEHQLAALLVLHEYILENNPGDATNYSAEYFLHHFRNRFRKASEFGGEGESQDEGRVPAVHLQPRLLQEGDAFELGFRIGKNKSYILKDIQQMMKAYDERGKLELGKNNTIDFAGEDFDEGSVRWLQMIRRSIREAGDTEEMIRMRLADRYYSLPQELRLTPKRTVSLHGSAMDDFFEIALAWGKPLEYERSEVDRYGRKKRESTEKRQLTAREEPLHLQFTMEPATGEDGDFIGVTLAGGMPKVRYGTDCVYYITEHHLNRARVKEAGLMRSLMDSRKEDGQIFLQFGRRGLAPLFHQILPALEPFVTVDMPDAEALERYIPPEAEFAFWLDAQDDTVTCIAEAIYGEERYNLIGRMDTSRQPEPDRDLTREDVALERLTGYFPYYDPRSETSFFYFEKDDDALFRLLDTGLHVLLQLGEVHTTNQFDRLKLRRKPQISVGVTIESDLMNLSILSEDMELKELLEVLRSYREKREYHRLRSGDFLRLDDPTIAELADMLDAMHISPKEFVKGKMHLPAYRALYLDRMLEEAEGLYTDRDRTFRQMVKEFKTVSDSDFEVPVCLQHVLRNYQKVGFQWLKTVETYGFGGVLADEMGLGKTVQIIAMLLSAKEAVQGAAGALDGNADLPLVDAKAGLPLTGAKAGLPSATYPCSLIVTPASLVYNWEEEFHKFAPQMNVCVIAGGQKARQKQIGEIAGLMTGAVQTTSAGSTASDVETDGIGSAMAISGAPDVLITSYDLLKRDIDLYEGMAFDYEIIDEAQFIKNHTTAAAKAVKVIHASHRFALTGTPIENRLSELWSIFDFLMPGFLYGYETFRKEFETPIAKRGDETAQRRLKRMVSPFILRRLKQDVLTDLPEKLEEIRYVVFESRQRRVYDSQVLRMKQMLEGQSAEEFTRDKIRILAELTRIRQICCDPSLLLEDYHGASAKREAALDLMVSASEAGHKMLVFSQFTSMLALLEEDLTRAGLPYYKIIGETPKRRRTELVKAFNEDDVPVFLISLKAGGTGLNLTGADIVIHYDPWWNLAVQNQATDRAHRIGQEKTVTVYRMITKDTIEEKIVDIQESKKELAEEILSGETGSLTRMSREELMELL